MFITTCLAYADIEAVSRLHNGVVHFTVNDKKHDISYNMTLNPMQAKAMGEFLSASAMQIIIPNSKSFGDGNLVTVLEDEQKIGTSAEISADVQSETEADTIPLDEAQKPLVTVNLVQPVNVSMDKEKAIA